MNGMNEAGLGVSVQGSTFGRGAVKRVCLIVVVLAAGGTVLVNRGQAAPVFGRIFKLRQPDGTPLPVRIWGDEFYRVIESLDGYTLVRDPRTRELCYARLSVRGDDLVSTGISASGALPRDVHIRSGLRVREEVARAKARAARERFAAGERQALSTLATTVSGPPCVGAVKGICLLVDFPDEPNSIAPSQVQDFCNGPGYADNGNNGSVRDYFFDVSDGALIYTNYVPTVYYRAQNKKTYYEYRDDDITLGVRARELVTEALEWLDARGFDFGQFDVNGDGLIDAINCFYAGTREGADAGLWPHSWTVDFEADGVSAYRYQISDMAGELTLGTFCHENGHLICWWPDLYDYGSDGIKSAGLGRFCLMSGGAYDENPVEPCAYLKMAAGWAVLIDLQVPQADLAVTAADNTFYRFPHPYLTNEFFLVSNRQRSGRDMRLPDSGLAIWHIDEEGSNDNEQMTPAQHYLVTLVQADGRWDLEKTRRNMATGTLDGNYGDDTDLFDGIEFDQCTPFTDPSTDWWAGNASTLSIRRISLSGPTMSFDFDVETSPPDAVDRAIVVVAGESTTINLKALDDHLPDPPGSLVYSITSLPEHGTLQDPGSGPIAQVDTVLVDFGDTVVYTAQAQYLGSDSFRFMAHDGGSSPTGGYSNEASISITISRPLYVDDDAPGDPGPGNPGVSDRLENGSAEHPFDTIQEAIDQAFSTETIVVLPGFYTGWGNRDIDLGGKPVTIRSEQGPETCVIDCQTLGRAFYFHSGEGPDSVLEGLTISNGSDTVLGGGVFCTNRSNPTFIGCIFTGNSAAWGGAIFNDNSSPAITDCQFLGNQATASGGAVYSDGSSLVLDGCTFSGNAAEYGGALCNVQCDAVIANCIFRDNSAGENGGAMTSSEGTAEITHSQFFQNSARFGGALMERESSSVLINCNIVDNKVSVGGGGLYSWTNSRPQLTNCIVWGNQGGAFQSSGGGAVIATFSDIQGGWPGDGNINKSPLFADSDKADYHLKSKGGRWDPTGGTWVTDTVTSPCIDAGDPRAPVGDEPGPNGHRINAGAYGGTSQASRSAAVRSSDGGNIFGL